MRHRLALLSFDLALGLGLCAACGPSQLGGPTGTAGRGGTGGSAGTTGGDVGGTGGDIVGTGTAGSTGASYTLTEWQIPFAGSQPFQIAATNDAVFYLNKDAEQRIGEIVVASGAATEWSTPYTATSPGDIEVRASDGSVFVAGATLGEIGQLDAGSGSLTRWVLPPEIAATSSPSGPWSLAFDGGGGVFFTYGDMFDACVGRLDTGTGDLRVWRFLGAAAARIVAAPDGTMMFGSWDGSVPYQIVRFDPASGRFTGWPLPAQPLFPAVADLDGTLFFELQSSSLTGLAWLSPSTGRLTAWRTPGVPDDSLAMESGRLYFAVDGGQQLLAIDVTTAGLDQGVIQPTVSAPVAPRSFHLSPSRLQLERQVGSAAASQRLVSSQLGAFETWAFGQYPRMKAAIPGAVYFTEEDHGAIGRLTR